MFNQENNGLTYGTDCYSLILVNTE